MDSFLHCCIWYFHVTNRFEYEPSNERIILSEITGLVRPRDVGNSYTLRPQRRSVQILRIVMKRQKCLAEADRTYYLVRLLRFRESKCFRGLQYASFNQVFHWPPFEIVKTYSQLGIDILCSKIFKQKTISKVISKYSDSCFLSRL